MPKKAEPEALVALPPRADPELEAVRLYGRAAPAPTTSACSTLAEAALQLGDEATAREALLRAELAGAAAGA